MYPLMLCTVCSFFSFLVKVVYSAIFVLFSAYVSDIASPKAGRALLLKDSKLFQQFDLST